MKKLKKSEIKEFLDEKAALYEEPSFLDTDPIHIPAKFSLKQDIEIAGFLTATIAWGNRKSIIKNATKLMEIMGQTPYDFIMDYDHEKHAELLEGFVHRTFNSTDLDYFIQALQYLSKNKKSMEDFFINYKDLPRINDSISDFKKSFFSLPHPSRTTKHVSDPSKNSAAKRINMFFR